MKTCVIVGQNYPDGMSDTLVAQHDLTLIFEPLDAPYRACVDWYAGKDVLVFELACGKPQGVKTMNVYNDRGVSSSLGVVTEESKDLYKNHNLDLRGGQDVVVVDLGFFLLAMGVEPNTVCIDAQGMDLTVLKTLKPFLVWKNIETLRCEADGDGKKMYDGLPDNSVEGFMEFMSQFPAYKFSMVPDRVSWNPDLQWALDTQ
jgi:hypothetical protein